MAGTKLGVPIVDAPLKTKKWGLKRTPFKKSVPKDKASTLYEHQTRKKGHNKGRDRADVLWRELVRLQWNNICAMTGVHLGGEGEEAGEVHHLIGRRSKLFRHDPKNGLLLSSSAHLHSPTAPHHSPEAFKIALRERHPDIADWLEENQGKMGTGDVDYETIIQGLKVQIEEQKKRGV